MKVFRALSISLMCLALTGCLKPKEPEKDAGKGDGPAISDGPKTQDANKTDAKKEAGQKDAKPPDATRPDLPLPSDAAPVCDGMKPGDASGICGAACVIKGKPYKAGDPVGDPCKTCDPSFSKFSWAPKKGCVVTIAGTGKAGYQDGDLHTAMFDNPSGIVVDTSGTIYVADTLNCVVRKIANGKVSTIGVQTKYATGLCGFQDGSFAVAKFNSPTGLVLGQAGEIYVAGGENARIRVIKSGAVATFAGMGSCGTTNHGTNPKAAYFCNPEGIATDGAGALYVSEFGNHMVRKVTSSSVSLVAGTDWIGSTPQAGYKDGPADKALFSGLSDIAVLPGNLVLVTERVNHVIRQIDLTAKSVSLFAGTMPVGTDPKSMTPKPGCVDNADPLKAKLQQPEAMAFDAKNKRVYFWGSQNNCLRMVQLPGKAVSTLNGSCNSSGLGSNCPYYYQDGDLLKAGFNGPEGMFVDKDGRVWVSDTGNHLIRVINP